MIIIAINNSNAPITKIAPIASTNPKQSDQPRQRPALIKQAHQPIIRPHAIPILISKQEHLATKLYPLQDIAFGKRPKMLSELDRCRLAGGFEGNVEFLIGVAWSTADDVSDDVLATRALLELTSHEHQFVAAGGYLWVFAGDLGEEGFDVVVVAVAVTGLQGFDYAFVCCPQEKQDSENFEG